MDRLIVILLILLILCFCLTGCGDQVAHNFTYQCIEGRVYMVENDGKWIEPFLDDQNQPVYCAE